MEEEKISIEEIANIMEISATDIAKMVFLAPFIRDEREKRIFADRAMTLCEIIYGNEALLKALIKLRKRLE